MSRRDVLSGANVAYRPLVIALVFFASVAVHAGEGATKFGVAVVSPSMTCATFQDQSVASGQVVYVITFDPQRWTHGHVLAKRFAPCDARALVEGSAYDVRLERTNGAGTELGIAVVTSDAVPAIEDGRVVFTGGSEPRPVTFGRCAGAEGIHFMAWREGKRIWHEYHYLGYDIEPDCSENNFNN